MHKQASAVLDDDDGNGSMQMLGIEGGDLVKLHTYYMETWTSEESSFLFMGHYYCYDWLANKSFNVNFTNYICKLYYIINIVADLIYYYW